MYKYDYTLMWELFLLCIKYIPITLFIASMTLLIGLFFGTLLAIARMSKIKLISLFSKIYILVMRGIPSVLFLIITYNLLIRGIEALSQAHQWSFNSSVIPKSAIAIFALSINASAILAETIRSALLSVQNGQYEAAYSIGMTKSKALWRIIIPQALPVAIPIIGSNLIIMIKATALVNLLGIIDILNAALIRVNSNYKFLEAYLISALVYWILTIFIEKIVNILSKRVKKLVGMEGQL